MFHIHVRSSKEGLFYVLINLSNITLKIRQHHTGITFTTHLEHISDTSK